MGYILYRHQVEASSLLVQGSGILWHQMRTGKTRTALHAYDELRSLGHAWPLIVVCPQIVKSVWVREIDTMHLPYSINVLSGRSFGGELSAEVIILNWDILAFRECGLPPGALVLDESHRQVNPRNKAYRAAVRLAKRGHRTWLLTGTLFKKSAMDIYWQCRLLGDENPFRGMSPDDFGEEYCLRSWNAFAGMSSAVSRTGRTGAWEYSGLQEGAEHRLLERAPCIHKLQEAQVRKVARQVRQVLWRSGESEDLMKFKARETAKHALSLDEPVVVAGWHNEFLQGVAELTKWPLVNGTVIGRARDLVLQDFQQGRSGGICINIVSAGIGIDLSRARRMVFGEVDWDEVNHIQAEARIRGPNQKSSEVFYDYILHSDSEDDRIMAARLRKAEDISRLDVAGMELEESG